MRTLGRPGNPALNVLFGPCAASAKACFGHTEGTAGIHGAAIAMLASQLHAAPPIMHSRSLNPYVSSAFDEWRTKFNVQPAVNKASLNDRGVASSCTFHKLFSFG